MSAGPALRVDRDGAVTVLTLNRPAQLNALSSELARELGACARTLAADDDARAVVITGRGSHFSAGADLRELGALADGAAFADFVRGLTDAFAAVRRLPIPSIAAVNGPALGGGFELVLSCDLRVAACDATFGLPEILLGLVPGAGGTQRLPAQVPPALAAEMLLLGDPIQAVRLHEVGLLNRVVGADDVLPTALGLATQLARCTPDSLATARRLLRVAGNGDASPLGVAAERALDSALFDGAPARARVDAFLARSRAPRQEARR